LETEVLREKEAKEGRKGHCCHVALTSKVKPQSWALSAQLQEGGVIPY
jgi:hypothetical protein